jgi:hypothetical protein
MSASIGELFKILGKNEIFSKYCKEIENEKSNNDIIDLAINDIELMNILNNVVSDISIIKNKMDVIIGQKRKLYNKNKDPEDNLLKINKNPETNDKKKNINKEEESIDTYEEESVDTDEEEPVVFKFEPINKDNVTYLTKYIYLEKVGLRLRLVTTEFELYY